MYLRAVHAESHIPTLRRLLRDNPLGILTTAIKSDAFPLIMSSHIPFILDVQDESSETELGVLRGHVARANPQSKVLVQEANDLATTSLDRSDSNVLLSQEVQILFHSTAQHYVTPKFYTETKPTSGKVVPTWNYAAVQAYGRIKVYHDTKAATTSSFLAKQIDDLSNHAEHHIMGYTGQESKVSAWKVSDAPQSYVDALKKGIIGIEVQLDRLEGKFKMSQEMGFGDRQGVVEGFKNLSSEVGNSVAALVDERSQLKESTKEIAVR